MIPYAERLEPKEGTYQWTFAVALPKTGGPYYLQTQGTVRVLWALT